MDTLNHFVGAIDAIIRAHDAPRVDVRVVSLATVAAATAGGSRTIQGGIDSASESEEFPPPFPDLVRDEAKTAFPPPYEHTGASYWSFQPDLPPPTSTTEAQLPPHSRTAAAQPSPGVGAYDTQRSDRTTLHQSIAFSFRKASDGHSLLSPSPLSASTPSKPRVHKTSLARSQSPTVFADAPSHQQTSDSADNDSTRRRIATAAPEYHDDNGERDDDDAERLEVDVLNALRRQHSMVVSDFLQDIVQHHHEPPLYSNSSSRSNNNNDNNDNKRTPDRKVTTATTTKWRSSSESRFVSRMRTSRASLSLEPSHDHLSRKRPQSAKRTSAKPEPRPAKLSTPKPAVKLPLPDGREPSIDEHLVWAARVGELYRAQQSVGE